MKIIFPLLFLLAGCAANPGLAWVGDERLYNGKRQNLLKKQVAVLRGTDSKIKLPKTYVLASDGDYIEFVAKANAKPTGSNVNELGLLGLDDGGLQNWVGFAQAGTQFAIRESAGSTKTLGSLTDLWFYQFARVRVTQTSSILWTISINGADVGTIVRAATISVNCIGNGYSTQFPMASIAELKIVTATTGNFSLLNISDDVDKKGCVVTGNVDFTEFSYDSNSLVLIDYPVSVATNHVGQLMLYVPQKQSTKHLVYILSKYNDASINRDSWMIEYVGIANAKEWPLIFEKSASYPRRLTSGGAWDSVVRLSGPADFSGSVHGGEVGDISLIVVDGVSLALDTFDVAASSGSGIQITKLSSIYKEVAGDYSAVLSAALTVNYEFDNDGLTSSASYNWLSSETVSYLYGSGLLPILRSDGGGPVTEWGYDDDAVYSIAASGFTQVPTLGDRLVTYSDTSGVTAEVTRLSDKLVSAAEGWIANNASPNYNKIYFNDAGPLAGGNLSVLNGSDTFEKYRYNISLSI